MELWWWYTIVGLSIGGLFVFICEQWEQTQINIYIAQQSKRIQAQRSLIEKAFTLGIPALKPIKASATRLIYQEALAKGRYDLEDLRKATLKLQSFYQAQLRLTAILKNNFPEHSGLHLEPVEFWQLLLIFNESISNAAQHAHAAYIINIVSLEDDHLNLITHDNGVGYDRLQTAEGAGITEIRAAVAYLGGHLQLSSTLGNGTIVNVAIPMSSARRLFKPTD